MEKESAVYLGLGSNLGNRAENINQAIDHLSQYLTKIKRARLYESLPLDVTDQPKFINTVVSGFYPGRPEELLAQIQGIERLLGRDRQKEREKGPRTIDIDILLFENRVMRGTDLTIPHPRIQYRRFVLVPLLELNAQLKAPDSSLFYAEYLKRVPPQGIYYFQG